ncbi:DUF3800 domain-containing protein [Acidianus sp. HS-5]|uniref:DUF3800 domain-containing protein n=1 Tax=Acidianus sp. HS-5 TaxID=2886040 RepID=UPI001F3B10E7|nr:DUF3800 domain-containing protein [Acidianus sp. HS-5]
MNKYYVFVDESYDKEVFVLAIVWTRSLKLVNSIKRSTLKKLNKDEYKFHFSDDRDEIKRIFLSKILNDSLNFGVLTFDRQPKRCEEYVKYYIIDVTRALPISNSLIYIYVKGLNKWIGKNCNIKAEESKIGIPNSNLVCIRFNYKKEERAGLEIADYIASLYRKCKNKTESLESCNLLENKLKFIIRYYET